MGKSVWKSPAARLLLLAAGASKIAGFHLPGFVFVDPPSPRITQAPSAAAVELRLRQNLLAPRVNTCASSCIASAVTKSTSCQLGDTACECKATNAEIIYDGAYGCVAVACGDLIAASEFFVSRMRYELPFGCRVCFRCFESARPPQIGAVDR